ncbi:MAG: glycosyltransferase [Flavitalea sp.]
MTDQADHINLTLTKENVFVVVPYLQEGSHRLSIKDRIEGLLQRLFNQLDIKDYLFWYYTPMALSFTEAFEPKTIVFDCMDELSAFKFAPPELKELESRLMQKAEVVFTGGQSLYEAKKDRHNNIHAFPSSIEKEHFYKARLNHTDPKDQAAIPHPRIGFYGVVDERFDIELLRDAATKRPNWHYVIIGPIVKIDPASLPKNKNIHYLGSKTYQELPEYLSGWDLAFIPFARNESTRYISPTKTPEYLSAGKPVISTSIRDVVNPYGVNKLVHIADNGDDFIKAAELEFKKKDRSSWLKQVDEFLADNSWDLTWKKMMDLINSKLAEKTNSQNSKTKETLYV